MDPEEGRREPFLEHLRESEKRLGASRHSVFDALFVGVIVVILLGGVTLGIMRVRTPTRVDHPQPVAAPSISTPAQNPTVEQPGRDDTPASRPMPSAAQAEKDQRRALPPVSTPAAVQSGKDERAYIDASKPGKYTIKDSKVEVEINTLSEKERNERLEQLKKEGLLTEKEAEALKTLKR